MEVKEIVARILDILIEKNHNFETIVIELAKRDPELLIKIVDEMTPAKFPDLQKILKEQGKIQAIKYVRNEAKIGLKEAKDFVDEYCYINGFLK